MKETSRNSPTSQNEGDSGLHFKKNKATKKGKSPYHILNPYTKEMERGEHIAPFSNEPRRSAIERIQGPTKESAALFSVINSAQNVLTSYEGSNNLSQEEAYLRSLQSFEKKGQSYRLELLTKMYKKAKKKAADLDNAGGVSAIPLKVHARQGGKVYNAISSLLYATISATKIDELEDYIFKKGATLPSSILDLGKWRGVLDVARIVRKQNQNDDSNRKSPTESAIKLSFADTAPVSTIVAAARPHTADGVFYKGNVLENDDDDLEANQGTAVRNNWMSPGVQNVVATDANSKFPTVTSATSTKTHAAAVSRAHASLVEAFRYEMEAMGAYMARTSEQIVHGIRYHEKKAKDTFEAHQMRVEQLELDLNRAHTTINKELAAKASMEMVGEDKREGFTSQTQSAAILSENLGEVVRDQQFVTDSHAALMARFDELLIGKEKVDRELEIERQELASLKGVVVDLQSKLAAEKQQGADLNISLQKAQSEVDMMRKKLDGKDTLASENLRLLRERHDEQVRVLKEEVESRQRTVTALSDNQNAQHKQLAESLQNDLRDARRQIEQYKKSDRSHSQGIPRNGKTVDNVISMEKQTDDNELAIATLKAELCTEKEQYLASKQKLQMLNDELKLEKGKVKRLLNLLESAEASKGMSKSDFDYLKSLAILNQGAQVDADTALFNDQKGNAEGHAKATARRFSASIFHDASFSHVLSMKRGSASPDNFKDPNQVDLKPEEKPSATESEEIQALKKRLAHIGGSEAKYKEETYDLRQQLISVSRECEKKTREFEDEIMLLQKEKAQQGAKLSELMRTVSILREKSTSAASSVDTANTRNSDQVVVPQGAHGHSAGDSGDKGGHDVKLAKFRHTVHAAKLISKLFLTEGHNRVVMKHVTEKSKREVQETLRESKMHGHSSKEKGSYRFTKSYEDSSSGADSEYDEGEIPPPLSHMASQLKETQHEMQVKERERKEAIEGSVKRIKMLMARIDDLKNNLRVSDAKIIEVEAENQEHRSKLEKRETKIIALKQRIATLTQENKDLLAELQDEKNRMEETHNRLSPLFSGIMSASPPPGSQANDHVEEDLLDPEEEEIRSKVADFMIKSSKANVEGYSSLYRKETNDSIDDESEIAGEKEDIVHESATGPSARSSFIEGGATNPNLSTKRSVSMIALDRKPPLVLPRGTSLSSIQETSTVKIQRLVRGFLARVHVFHLMSERLARREGIMVAYRGSGTRQGEAGWYVANNELFYFAVDKGEYVLVCGPLSEAEYDAALTECVNKGIPPRPQFHGEIHIDRLGLVALRLEIARYKREVQQAEFRAGPKGPAQQQMALVQEQLREREGELVRLHNVIKDKEMEIQNAHDERIKQINIADELRKKMTHLRVEMTSAKDALHVGGAGSGALTVTGPSRVPTHRGPQAYVYAAKLATMGLTPTLTMGIIKLQALIRAFIVRSKNKQQKEYERARIEGILTALKGTRQGHSGWYLAPNGNVYYFILKDEEWIITAGPLSMSAYHELFYSPYNPWSVNSDRGSPIGTPESSGKKEISGARQHRKSLRKRKVNEKTTRYQRSVLRRVACELQVEHPELHGDLFVDRATKTLYMAVNVNQLVGDSVVVDPTKEVFRL